MVLTRMSLPVAKHASSVLSLESTRVNLRAHYYFSLARVGIFFSRARDHHRSGQSLTPHSLKISYRSPNFYKYSSRNISRARKGIREYR